IVLEYKLIFRAAKFRDIYCDGPAFFFFNAPATPEIYTLSLHDALPISHARGVSRACEREVDRIGGLTQNTWLTALASIQLEPVRSEEHTSELQSRSDLVCRLLLEKKKRKPINRP